MGLLGLFYIFQSHDVPVCLAPLAFVVNALEHLWLAGYDLNTDLAAAADIILNPVEYNCVISMLKRPLSPSSGLLCCGKMFAVRSCHIGIDCVI